MISCKEKRETHTHTHIYIYNQEKMGDISWYIDVNVMGDVLN